MSTPFPPSEAEPAVVVVGGGIVGLATTVRLAERGARVTLLEAETLGAGTSGASFAWLNANDKPPFAYHMLNVSGMAEYGRLRRELQAAPWLHLDGHAQWAAPGEGAGRLAHKVERLREWGYPVEWLTPSEFRSLEPGVVVADAVDRVAYFASEGYVEVAGLVAALARRARSLGVSIRTGFRVASVEVRDGRVAEVVSANGEPIGCAALVLCAGHRVDEIGSMFGVTIPLRNTAGLIVVAGAPSVDLRTTLTTRHVNARPDGDARYCVQAPDLDALIEPDMPPSVVAEIAHEVLRRGSHIVPALVGSHLERASIAIRPIPADGLPLVGPVPGVDGAYLVVTHSGVTLGPLLGRLAAQEITNGLGDERLADLRPSRLLASDT